MSELGVVANRIGITAAVAHNIMRLYAGKSVGPLVDKQLSAAGYVSNGTLSDVGLVLANKLRRSLADDFTV